MSATEESQNKCSQKTALSLFFLLELIAHVLGCVALISPSWQYVYLENGRTEHHHGLWLDCKRDYSHDYGRSREYYETLYRLNKQQSPFDQFFLTSLLCVYKFDYFIDMEDLYDHNHDENRLQDDANQHLLLGWKIVSLAAFGFATLAASAALLLSVCAFCHRTLICAAAVLVTVAALLSSMGLLIFYIWANHQDNNIIKEEDGIYEQYFGWALYMQIAGTTTQFFASFLGCAVTSMAFRKSRAKLVKIEVIDRDNSTLIDRTVSLPFKRSFSAIYKLDSADLQKWERDYINIIQSDSITKRSSISAPDFKKYPRKNKQNPQESKITKSTSNLFDQPNLNTAFETFPQSFSFPVPKSILKVTSKQPSTVMDANRRLSDDLDLTYEYLPDDLVGNSRSTETLNRSFTTDFTDISLFGHSKDICNQGSHSRSPINVYDKVYEYIPDIAKSRNHEQANSCFKNIAISADKILIRSGLIFIIFNKYPTPSKDKNRQLMKTLEHLSTMCLPVRALQPLSFTNLVPETITVPTNRCTSGDMLSVLPNDPRTGISNLQNFLVERNAYLHFPNRHSLNHVSDCIAINTFDFRTLMGREGERSIKNLVFRPQKDESIEAFKRADNSSEHSSLNKCMPNKSKTLDPITKIILPENSDIQMTCSVIPTPYMCSADEMDRSIGSLDTFNSNAAIKNNDQQFEAKLCLNLFMNGGVASLLTGNNSDNDSAEAKKSNITTV
ncbi:Clc-like family protein [Brugia pahangi]